ncbi:MAG: hypothetical protein QG663_744 [Thermodesulfobacteriota bacterium]|nr:hypothetical protein [Thermodesulfobacteriota bacterium]
MSRPLSVIEYENAWYHVMNRGGRFEDIFADRYAIFQAYQESMADPYFLNNEVEVHHEPEGDPCDACIEMNARWENRIIEEAVVYDS